MGRPRTTPVKNTRLAQMLKRRAIEVEKPQPEIAAEFGWSKQAFNTWLAGSVPRAQMFGPIGRFLGLPVDKVEELAAEAAISTGNTKLPDMGAPVKGKGTPGTVILDRFASGYARPGIAGCYAIRVDGRFMWVNPRLKPADGNTVLVRAGEVGKIMKWPNEFVTDGVSEEGIEQHVVVLQELV